RGASEGSETCPNVIRTGARLGKTCGRFHTERHCFAHLDVASRTEFGDDVECPRWAELLRSRVAIFDLDYDVIISAMYALSFSAEGDCYRCVPPDPGIAAAALGASASGTPPGTAPAEALHTFTLDSGASHCFFRDSTTLTPLPAPVPVRLADASGGPIVARSSTVLPCPAVSASGQVAASCSCRLLSHKTLLWHHRLGHPSLPRLRGMHSRLPVSGLPRYLPPLPPSPAPPSLPCFEGRQRATPHSSSFPPTTAPLQTLHMDVWGPARINGQGRERYFLLVVDDYTRYTTVFPLRSKGEVSAVLIPWIRSVCLQLRARFGQDHPVLRLHSDRGGEFSSDLLRDFCLMEVARTSMIHAAAPHFLWPFAKSTGTYVDEVPPPGVNIVDGMWIFRVKRPPGSPPNFKARYVARGFSQRQGVDYFHTFSPTPKMTTLRVLLHVAAQHEYELHSLDFSTAFLQGSLHEEIWLRRPSGFTWSFPTAHPSLFLRTVTSAPPFYVLVYVDDLVFAMADTEALTLVKSEM
ncbi:unnamed protein product, partial [Closterium sp. NIES-54]